MILLTLVKFLVVYEILVVWVPILKVGIWVDTENDDMGT